MSNYLDKLEGAGDWSDVKAQVLAVLRAVEDRRSLPSTCHPMEGHEARWSESQALEALRQAVEAQEVKDG